MTKLIIRYDPDPRDAVGKLWFDVTAEQFSGSAFFWSDLSEVPRLVSDLRNFPLQEPAIQRWGYNSLEGSDLVLSLGIAQVGRNGSLKAMIELADPFDLSRRLTTSLTTDYASVERLSTELAAMAAQRVGEAVLDGS